MRPHGPVAPAGPVAPGTDPSPASRTGRARRTGRAGGTRRTSRTSRPGRTRARARQGPVAPRPGPCVTPACDPDRAPTPQDPRRRDPSHRWPGRPAAPVAPVARPRQVAFHTLRAGHPSPRPVRATGAPVLQPGAPAAPARRRLRPWCPWRPSRRPARRPRRHLRRSAPELRERPVRPGLARALRARLARLADEAAWDPSCSRRRAARSPDRNRRARQRDGARPSRGCSRRRTRTSWRGSAGTRFGCRADPAVRDRREHEDCARAQADDQPVSVWVVSCSSVRRGDTVAAAAP